MNVLSLFDGMSCGRIALDRAKIPVTTYYASEIDPYAIRVSKANWPDIIHIGDVINVNGDVFPQIDLLIAGSPCQGFSFAGLQLNFDDKKSKLFFEFVRILKQVKPKYFMLENVKMKQEFQNTITAILNIEPICINSCYVSGQKRKRVYWTNIPNVEQYFKQIEPDKTILSDYLQLGMSDPELYLKPHEIERANIKYSNRYWKSGNRIGKMQFPDNVNKKSRCLCSTIVKGSRETIHINDVNGIRILTNIEFERIQGLPDNYTQEAPKRQRYKMIGNGWESKTITHIFKALTAQS